ncbi:metallophosphoesterase family protein [Tessaracoccus lubricantis]
MYGDPQIGSGGGQPSDGAAWAKTVADSIAQFPAADFLYSMGDQVNTAGSEAEYVQFLAPDGLRQYPLATTIGNHDNGSTSYGQHFFMPNTSTTVGVPGTPPREGMGNYWFKYDNVLFLNVNSNAGTDDQHFAWLREVIAAEGAGVDWKVLTFHHSPYSTASHADDTDIIRRRASFPPVISELNIDLVFGGHDHIYSRTHLLNRGHAVGDLTAPATLAKQPGENLWLTLNSSSGSKYYVEDPIVADFTFNAVSAQARVPSYSRAEVTPTSFRVVTYQADGVVTDDVTLTRAPEGATPNPVLVGDPVVDFWGDGSNATLGDKPVPNVTDENGVTTVEARILRPNDDVEEYVLTEEMYLDSSDLELTWERPTSTTDVEDQLIGLRYDAVQIPAGASIESAYIQFTVDEPNKSVGESNLDIRIEDTDHAEKYLLTAGNVSERTFSEASVNWRPAEWPVAQEAGPAQATPDLAALVQSVVDRDDWFRGNALSFVITGTGARTAEAYEGGTGLQAPRLFVTYTMGDRTEVEARIQTDRDDVEQYLEGASAGAMDHGSSDLELTWERPTREVKDNQIIGLRYAGLDIPQGAVIEQAHVQFTTDEATKTADPFLVTFRGEAADDSAPFSDAAWDLSNRARTDVGVTWGEGVPVWTLDQEQRRDQRTTDIAAAVQEVVDRDGWKAGNALTLLIEGQGTRTAESFEGGGAAEAPVLFVVYSDPKDEEPTEEPSPEPSAEPSKSPSGQPTKPAERGRKAPYEVPGLHKGLNGRDWLTSCEAYSQTERCRTDIWATTVVAENGRFVVKQGWAFNNMTYLASARALWKGNPLGESGEFSSAGRQWRTECDTEATGRGACRSYARATVVSAKVNALGTYEFSQAAQWVFNSAVLFSN